MLQPNVKVVGHVASGDCLSVVALYHEACEERTCGAESHRVWRREAGLSLFRTLLGALDILPAVLLSLALVEVVGRATYKNQAANEYLAARSVARCECIDLGVSPTCCTAVSCHFGFSEQPCT